MRKLLHGLTEDETSSASATVCSAVVSNPRYLLVIRVKVSPFGCLHCASTVARRLLPRSAAAVAVYLPKATCELRTLALIESCFAAGKRVYALKVSAVPSVACDVGVR